MYAISIPPVKNNDTNMSIAIRIRIRIIKKKNQATEKPNSNNNENIKIVDHKIPKLMCIYNRNHRARTRHLSSVSDVTLNAMQPRDYPYI